MTKVLFSVFSFLLFTSPLLAAPGFVVIEGQLFSDAAGLAPLEAASVDFTLQVLSPDGNQCILYEENYPSIDMSNSGGLFNFKLGAGTSTANDHYNNLLDALNNHNGVSVTGTCVTASYTASAGDSRLVRIIYNSGSGSATLANDIEIGANAYATNANSLQGKQAADFLQVNTSGHVLTQTNLESIFTSANFTELNALLAGTSSSFSALPAADVNNNNQKITNVANPTLNADATNKQYVDGKLAGQNLDTSVSGVGAPQDGHVLSWDNTNSRWELVAAGSGDFLANGSVAMTGTLQLGAQYINGDGTASTGMQISNGGNVTVTGSVSANGLSTGTTLAVYNGDGSFMGFQTPASSADLIWSLPNADAATSGQVLQSNAAGVLSWRDVGAGDFMADGSVAMTGALTLNSQNEVRFSDAAGGEYAAIKAPATIGTNYTLTLPVNAPLAGQILESNASGVFTWIDKPTPAGATLADGTIWVGNGSNQAASVTMSGDVTMVNTGAVTIGNNAITSAKINDGEIVNADINASAAIAATKLAGGSVDNTEFGYLDGVTSSIQTQMDAKLGSSLNSANIFVGNAGNTAAAVTMSGDATIDNSGAVTIANNAISAVKLADLAVSTQKVTDNAITTAKINDLAVVSAKIANNAVNNAKISDVAIDKITNAAGLYLDYRPNNTACAAGEVLKWDNTNSRWDCGADNGAGGDFMANGSTPMTGNLQLGNNWLSNDGDSEGIQISVNGNVGIGTNTPAGLLDVNGDIRMLGSTSGYTGLQAPAVAPDLVYTLPTTAPGAGQILESTAAGVMSWVDVPAGADDMGDHTATQNIVLGANYLSGDGGNEGLQVDAAGHVTASGNITVGANLTVANNTIFQAQVRNYNGTFTAPSYSFQSASNSGMYWNSGSIRLSNAGNDIFVIASDDQVGIGTINPSAALDIRPQTGAEDLLRLRNNAGAPQVVVSSAGNIGIGVTTPSEKLDVAGNISLTDGAPRTIDVKRALSGGGNDLMLVAGGTAASEVDVGGGNLVLSSGLATGDGGSNIVFRTADHVGSGSTDSAPSDKMVINHEGYVGIANMAPQHHLDVAGTIFGMQGEFNDLKVSAPTGPTMMKIENENPSGFPIVRGFKDRGTGAVNYTQVGDKLLALDGVGSADGDNFYTTPNVEIALKATENYNTSGTSYGSQITFSTNENGTIQSLDERMVINHDGKVGIGINNPDSLLHLNQAPVVGTITSSGTTVTGASTSFQTQLKVGDVIYANGQFRTVNSIASNTSLTIDTGFTSNITVATNYKRVLASFDGGTVRVNNGSGWSTMVSEKGCPSGMQPVGDRYSKSGFCVESTHNTAAAYSSALTTCASVDPMAFVCSAKQMRQAYNFANANSDTLFTSDMTTASNIMTSDLHFEQYSDTAAINVGYTTMVSDAGIPNGASLIATGGPFYCCVD